ncbi:Bromodomain containing protein [Parasponia andersonii]|uniref:Bromodomain containing protein n=1 Tax=Parasponia andersonii TaxID=3476 RepID=A0A2P5C0L8_PARAD|nr:Bromodomain containing protein [Parasponia andersonii]
MIATETIVPNKKLKIKFTNKRIEADTGIRSCVAGQHVSLAKTSVSGVKRGPIWTTEGQNVKRQKIDRSMMVQCAAILRRLMTHEVGWVFKQPVDPVALNIPDYFSIISHPMDLGTIKSKLEKNVYSGIEDFAADIRLTFSNAMLYNPPSNGVHVMAKKLSQIFEMSWKILEEKCNGDGSKVESGRSSSGQIKKVTHTPQKNGISAPLADRSADKRRIPSGEKVVRCSSEKDINRGTERSSGRACVSVNAKEPCSPALRKCSSCSSIACRCSLSSDLTHVSLSDISSDRSLGRGDRPCSVASRTDCQAKSLSTSQISKSDPDSDGAVSALDDENMCPSSQLITPTTDAASNEEWNTPVVDVPLSPKKALRAAMLKCRFADTILKAKQKTLLDHGDNKSNPKKLKQEKEILERRQREEKARIEAEIQAAEAASRLKAEIELKQQREREREAARVALAKVEKTITIEQNLEVLRELELLSGFKPSCYIFKRYKGRGIYVESSGQTDIRSPLERLGLFIKEEYLVDEDEDEEAILNGEEGEILDSD